MPTPAFVAIPAGHQITARTGHRTVTRPATEGDLDAVNDLHRRCTLDSRFSRYQAARRSLSASEWSSLVRPDRGRSWVTHPGDAPHLVIAATHLLHTGHDHVGELGLLIEDAWQSRGLGTQLTRYAIAQAPALGVRAITVMTGRDNARMLRICRSFGAHTPRHDGSTVSLTLPVN
ncbi:N-acetyltransferase family protein [Streptomyces chartreusis]